MYCGFSMNKTILASVRILIVTALLLASCSKQYSKPTYVVTNHPLEEILRRVVKED